MEERKLCQIECEMTQPVLEWETLDKLTDHQDPDQERMEEQELADLVTKNLQV